MPSKQHHGIDRKQDTTKILMLTLKQFQNKSHLC